MPLLSGSTLLGKLRRRTREESRSFSGWWRVLHGEDEKNFLKRRGYQRPNVAESETERRTRLVQAAENLQKFR